MPSLIYVYDLLQARPPADGFFIRFILLDFIFFLLREACDWSQEAKIVWFFFLPLLILKLFILKMPGSTSSILFDLSLLRQFKLQPWLSHHCMVFLVQPTSILTSVEVFNLLWSLTFLRQQFLLNSDVINGHGILTVEGIFARVYPLAVVLLCRGTCLQSDYLIWVVRLLVWVKGFGQILAFERLMTAVMQLLSTLFFTQFLLQQWINHNTWTIVTVLG